MGIAVTWAGNDEILSSADKKNVILFLSLAGSTVAGYVSFMNPALKWRQLRGAAMTLESHVWMFRARAGEYRVASCSNSKLSSPAFDHFLQHKV